MNNLYLRATVLVVLLCCFFGRVLAQPFAVCQNVAAWIFRSSRPTLFHYLPHWVPTKSILSFNHKKITNTQIGVLTIDAANAIKPKKVEDLVVTFPNPSNGLITILSKQDLIQQIKIHNTVGQTVYRNHDFNTNTVQLDLQHFKPATNYTITIITTNGAYTKRIVIR